MTPVVCDGCGQPATEEHLARRIRRLEIASRFRPIHIQILFLMEAPPPRDENYFYCENQDLAARSGLSRALFQELMSGLSIDASGLLSEEECLLEFQKRGFFLADALECPYEDAFPDFRERPERIRPAVLAHRLGPTLGKRVSLSLRPNWVVPISVRMRHVLPYLEAAGQGSKVLLYQGLPLHFPHPANPVAQALFRAGLADVLAQAQHRGRQGAGNLTQQGTRKTTEGSASSK